MNTSRSFQGVEERQEGEEEEEQRGEEVYQVCQEKSVKVSLIKYPNKTHKFGSWTFINFLRTSSAWEACGAKPDVGQRKRDEAEESQKTTSSTAVGGSGGQLGRA
ncbi:uncharacterized protein V6R79_008374 [Siganus canaliculatus]